MSTGVFLARMQPLHNGHMEIIKKMLEENDKVFVFIGSADKAGTERNPLECAYRKYLLDNASLSLFQEEEDYRIKTYCLNDWTDEDDRDSLTDWGNYLFYNIANRIGEKSFNMYFSEKEEDILPWFEPRLLGNINLIFSDRKDICNGISATKVREAFVLGDIDFIKKNCPSVIIEDFSNIRRIIMKTKSL